MPAECSVCRNSERKISVKDGHHEFTDATGEEKQYENISRNGNDACGSHGDVFVSRLRKKNGQFSRRTGLYQK
jgi:hypothetical protein